MYFNVIFFVLLHPKGGTKNVRIYSNYFIDVYWIESC